MADEQTKNTNSGGFRLSEMLSPKQSAVQAAEPVINQLSAVDPKNVGEMTASQIKLLLEYYDLSLTQATKSFFWAVVASLIGLLFFLGAIAALLFKGSGGTELAIFSTIGGVITQFIAGVNFTLYGKTLNQLNHYQSRLERTQRFLLANSLCENLDGKLKDFTRARLIASMADIDDKPMPDSWLDDRDQNRIPTPRRPSEGNHRDEVSARPARPSA